MTYSVIDIGTNTVLLLVATVSPDGWFTPLKHEQRIPRLGKGVDQHRVLHPDSMMRVVEVLKEYRELAARFHPDISIVCGTSAVRDAANRDAFAALVKQQTGFTLEVLTGEEEALWTYRGAISGGPELSRATVVDIGGGSTEIIIGNRTSIEQRTSIDMGSVRLTERFFQHDPPTDGEIEMARAAIVDGLMATFGFRFEGSTLVAVAGTATTLAMLAQGLHAFEIRAVTNYRMTRDTVEHLCRTLRAMPVSKIRDLSSVMAGRADVILAGTLILSELMTRGHFAEAIVSERGVRYGLVLREAEKQRAQ